MTMATLSGASSTVLVLLLIFAVGTLMPMVKGDVCTEDMGACDPDCSSRCTSAHPGAKAGCDLNNNNPVCRCFYDCGPPSPPPYSKKCKISLGIWGENCSESDCNSQCASKYPGPQEGSGYCYSVGAPFYTSCFCEYKC
ncbi:hypothetical protein C1H46_003525 [Malus baccata]|uniref:Defensin-like protein n=1 Tax=Malus baccata TaxID=106549 RepID=A0A540NIG6_MALBA|nr:hypothetical protein C1H46_003525 [Malus baccata]